MANVSHVLRFEADAAQPVAEINNVIVAFLRLHQGREAEILTAIRSEIDKAIPMYQQEQRPRPPSQPVRQVNPNRKKRRR